MDSGQKVVQGLEGSFEQDVAGVQLDKPNKVLVFCKVLEIHDDFIQPIAVLADPMADMTIVHVVVVFDDLAVRADGLQGLSLRVFMPLQVSI